MLAVLEFFEKCGVVIGFITLTYLYFFIALCVGYFFMCLAQDIIDLFKKK